jgi:hypothetical protein
MNTKFYFSQSFLVQKLFQRFFSCLPAWSLFVHKSSFASTKFSVLQLFSVIWDWFHFKFVRRVVLISRYSCSRFCTLFLYLIFALFQGSRFSLLWVWSSFFLSCFYVLFCFLFLIKFFDCSFLPFSISIFKYEILLWIWKN